MKKNLFLLIFVFTTNIFSQQNSIKLSDKDLKNFSIDDLLSMKRITDPHISPDGKWVVYNMDSPDVTTNKKNKAIYVTSIEGKETQKLTSGISNDYNPRWSPDGKQIAYLSTSRGPAPQIFTMDFPKGEPKMVSAIKEGCENLAWSPDGNLFSFTSEVKTMETVRDRYPNLKNANVMIYNKLMARHWDHWIDEKRSHLFIMPSKGGKETDLMAGEDFDCPLQPMGGGNEIDWSNDSKSIAYTSRKVDNEAFSTNSDIYLINIETKSILNITKGMEGYDKEPNFSPDGKLIAFKSQERASLESDRIRLMTYNIETKVITEISKNLDQWVGDFVWSSDGQKFYFAASFKGTEPLFEMSLDGTFKRLTEGMFDDASGIDLSVDGKTLIFGRTSMTHPVDIYKMNLTTGKIDQITNVNKDILIKIRDINVDEKWFTSPDGSKVQAWIAYPPKFDAKQKYPMITYCQGGPQSMISHYWSYRWNIYLMASQGYVVVAPNRRGAPGFGQKWVDAISKDWGGGAMQDILAATDSMSNEVYIDKNRRAAVGASAGGYAAYYLAGNHQNRFSAFIAHCGVFNLESMAGATEEQFFTNSEFGGPYWDPKNKEIYTKNSPHNYVQNWNTPIMIVTGEKDFRVPYTQSLEAFTAAQSKGIPSKLMVFPEENHWVLNLQNAFIWHTEFFSWLDKYCKSKK